MDLVLIYICNIIDQIKSTRNNREEPETDQRDEEVVKMEKMTGEDEGGEEKKVLHPMGDAH